MVVATNLTGLHAEPSFLCELLTQVTNGVQLAILERRERWCRVRQIDGYEGWAYESYLAAAAAPRMTHLVTAPWTAVYPEVEGSSHAATRLLGGTGIEVVEVRGDWCLVQPAGAMLPRGWVSSIDLFPIASLPLSPAHAREQIVNHARALQGVYYLWGGCSAWGIDCSGLAQLVHKLAGFAIPRDAYMQFDAGRVVEPPFEAGDLLFFGGESGQRKITPVGISTGGWKMIHSSRRRNGVYDEDVQEVESLRNSFAGARTFVDRALA